MIFACLNFRDFFFVTFIFFSGSAIIIIIFTSFLNSRICPPREIRENENLANNTRSTVCDYECIVLLYYKLGLIHRLQ